MVQGLRPPGVGLSRPDGSVGFTGREGNLLEQDGAKAVFRGGVTAENGDFSVKEHDLIEEDLIIPLDEVGGASLVNATIVSLGDSEEDGFDPNPGENPTEASRAFTARIEDLAPGADVMDPDESDVLDRRTPNAVDGAERARVGFGLYSDNGRIVVEHDSTVGGSFGENLINASFNVQSGSTDAIQIRGTDGTVQDPDNTEQLEALADVLGDGLEALAQTRSESVVDEPVGPEAESGDTLVTLDTRGSSIVSVNIDVDGDPIGVRYDTSPDDAPVTGVGYFENARTIDGSPDGQLQDFTRLRDELQTGSRYVRVVLTDPADTESTATIAVTASG